MYSSKKKENRRSGRLLTLVLLALAMPLLAQETTLEDPILSDTAEAAISEDTERLWEEQLKTELDKFAAEAENAYFNTGICVWDLTADSLLWGYNDKKVMRPASTQKVVTAVSALSTLGAQHEFRTRGYCTGEFTADSTLLGDIYIVGDFDPMYSYSDLKELASGIRNLGIRSISGTIYGDASMKSQDLYGNGWCWDDVPSKNEPFLCALMLERGTIYPDFKKYSEEAAFHPAEHFVYALSQELKKLNVTAADSTASAVGYGLKEYPYDGKNFYTKTRTIEQVMQQMLKESDNLHAEAVFFQLAHLNSGRHCTWKDGARQVENVLRQAGVATTYLEVADGSGVSLYNYISPNAMTAMLRHAYQNKDIFQHLYPALPIAGVDGTLKDRMKSGDARFNVRAKTGTLKGVITLCGYVKASNGHQLAFSIFVNGVLTAKTARDFQDRICQELAR